MLLTQALEIALHCLILPACGLRRGDWKRELENIVVYRELSRAEWSLRGCIDLGHISCRAWVAFSWELPVVRHAILHMLTLNFCYWRPVARNQIFWLSVVDDGDIV
jgi:hypothetical protein